MRINLPEDAPPPRARNDGWRIPVWGACQDPSLPRGVRTHMHRMQCLRDILSGQPVACQNGYEGVAVVDAEGRTAGGVADAARGLASAARP